MTRIEGHSVVVKALSPTKFGFVPHPTPVLGLGFFALFD